MDFGELDKTAREIDEGERAKIILLKEEKALSNLVNRLISQSFGPRFKGTCKLLTPSYFAPYYEFSDIGLPNEICRLSFFKRNIRRVGAFKEPNGSVLEVNRSYIDCAKKYAESYKKETGKDIKIEVLSDYMNSIGWCC